MNGDVEMVVIPAIEPPVVMVTVRLCVKSSVDKVVPAVMIERTVEAKQAHRAITSAATM